MSPWAQLDPLRILLGPLGPWDLSATQIYITSPVSPTEARPVVARGAGGASAGGPGGGSRVATWARRGPVPRTGGPSGRSHPIPVWHRAQETRCASQQQSHEQLAQGLKGHTAKRTQHKAYSLCFIAKGAFCASQQLGSMRRRVEKGGQRRRMHRWELTQGLALLH